MNPNPDSENSTTYKVVANDDEQYSIWPTHCSTPSGWRDVGAVGSKEFCLAYVKKIWTDMLFYHLKNRINEMACGLTELAILAELSSDPRDADGQALLQRFANPDQLVEVVVGTDSTVSALMTCIGNGYIPMKFTDADGEVELGVILDRDAVAIHAVDFENHKGIIHLEGDLIISCQKIRCIADINLETFSGRGCLRAVKA
ncbi:MAG TPA: MbtH family protein [Candidatus Angelobacter sp.]|jgi:MbtH protein|nr:MbtH family protein [Candidatus Angelobacter sp.]